MIEVSTNIMEFLELLDSFEINDNPFQSREYYITYFENYGNGKYLFLKVYNNYEVLIGLAPLIEMRCIPGFVHYTFIGYRKGNYLGYICKAGQEKYVHAEIKSYFENGKKAYIINYYDINNTNPLYKILIEDDCVQYKIELYKCPLVILNRDFEAFFKSKITNSKKRSEMRKFEKKLGLVGKVNMIQIYDEASYEEYKIYLEQIYHIHNERFEKVYTPSHFSDIKYREYYNKLIERMTRAKKAFISLLLVDDIVISFIFCLANQKTLIDWIPAFDPAFTKYNLGTIHYKMLFEYLCKTTNYEYFDFSKGESIYKLRWSDMETINYQFVSIYNPNFMSSIANLIDEAKFKFKSFLRGKGILKKIKFVVGHYIKDNSDTKKTYSNIEIEKRYTTDNVSITSRINYDMIRFFDINYRKEILDAVYEGKAIEILHSGNNKLRITIWTRNNDGDQV